MANILDYLDWRGDLTFAQSPFQAVDNLILSCLSYIHFGGIVEAEGEEGVPLPLADALFSASGEEKERVRSPLDGELLHKAAKSRRFRDARLYRYVNRLNLQEEKQFADTLYQILTATGAVRLKDLSAGWLKNSLAMLHAAGNLKKESKEQLARVFTLLLSSAGRTMLRSLPEGPF